jgi:hypothetical protein
MGESFDHRPAGRIRQSRKRCIQLIHNRMVVDYSQMSSVDFGVPDFRFLISETLTPALFLLPCAAYRSRVRGLTEVQVRKALIFPAAGEGQISNPQPNPQFVWSCTT